MKKEIRMREFEALSAKDVVDNASKLKRTWNSNQILDEIKFQDDEEKELTRLIVSDYEELCRLDIASGLPAHIPNMVKFRGKFTTETHKKYRKQIIDVSKQIKNNEIEFQEGLTKIKDIRYRLNGIKFESDLEEKKMNEFTKANKKLVDNLIKTRTGVYCQVWLKLMVNLHRYDYNVDLEYHLRLLKQNGKK